MFFAHEMCLTELYNLTEANIFAFLILLTKMEIPRAIPIFNASLQGLKKVTSALY